MSPSSSPTPPLLPPDLTVFERGWLSSNNVLVHDAAGNAGGAVLVDSGHCNHAAQTVALVRRALDGAPLARIVNTHLHSDHCGGNAEVSHAFGGVPVDVPPGGFGAAQRWDEDALSYRATGQRCVRFMPGGTIRPNTTERLGGRDWAVIAAPGHDPDAVMLFEAMHGVLISGDALWENGFGVVFPELEGEHAFDDVAAVLDAIERLPVAAVVPGHGAPFADVPAALARARSRLAAFRADPGRHARHAAKVLLKYHVMEEGRQAMPALCGWAGETPLFAAVWQRTGRGEAPSPAAWAQALAEDMAAGGALRIEDGVVEDC